MITCYNCESKAGRIIDLALEAKGVKYNTDTQSWSGTNYPVIVDDNHVVQGLNIVLNYLEHRYPAPSLIPNDPVRGSLVMMMVQRHIDPTLEIDYDLFQEHLSHHFFIAGDLPTFADVAISALAPQTMFWNAFRKRLQISWGSWDNSL